MSAVSAAPHAVSAEALAAELGVDPDAGLPPAEAAARLAAHGPNALAEAPGRTRWRILYEQFAEPMVLLLVGAAAVSLGLGEYTDAAVILLIVVLNAALGFFQDSRAEHAMAALKSMAVPTVTVRRGGGPAEVGSKEIVPGDVVTLEAGARVPADGRLISASNLKVEEAALTGESQPVLKHASQTLPADAPLADRANCAFSGTVVTAGRGRLLVTATGMGTELGRIAGMIQGVETESTPLQKRLAGLGKSLAVAVAGIIAVVVGLELLRRDEYTWPVFQEVVQTALSMAVAAIPEGLPAVATITLALGARRMLKRNALIRRLPAVETLGSVTVICSDKTGTLTQNKMTVTVLDAAGDRVDFSGDVPAGLTDRAELALLLAGADLCNDAEPSRGGDGGAVGDPTETALVVAAGRAGLDRDRLRAAFPRVAELPFESDRKRMTTVHNIVRDPGPAESPAETAVKNIAGSDAWRQIAFTKGAVDSLLGVCDAVWDGGTVHELDDGWRDRIEAANAALAADGVRVLAVAFRPFEEDAFAPDEPAAGAEEALTFVGLLGLIDPARPEAAAAIRECRTAGVRVKMITGDHPLTAGYIARDLGLTASDRVVTGRELDAMLAADDGSFGRAAAEAAVFARVTPEHKLRLVAALRDAGEVVAMTGDGVNDAPALKRADIGVAMGVTGTDVSKEAAAMVLTDDNFATIVAAVKEGRTVYANVRKFLKYTLTSNAGEIWVMLFGPLLGLFAFASDRFGAFERTPLPLLPLQILWINLVTDGLPGLALAVEPSEKRAMDRPPVDPAASLLGGRMARHIVWVGLTMGLLSFFVGWAYWDGVSAGDAGAGGGAAGGEDAGEEYNVALFRTVVFTVLTLSQMGHALAVRSDTESLFSQGLLSNKLMVGSVALTFALQVAIMYVPPLAALFHVVPLGAFDFLVCLAASTAVFWAVELEKWAVRRRGAAPNAASAPTGAGRPGDG